MHSTQSLSQPSSRHSFRKQIYRYRYLYGKISLLHVALTVNGIFIKYVNLNKKEYIMFIGMIIIFFYRIPLHSFGVYDAQPKIVAIGEN